MSRITSIPNAIDALDAIGISIKDSAGEMRNFDDIIDDLGAQWSGLSKEQQQNLGLQIAGRYQLSRFLIMMERYDEVLGATESATNSYNSAVRENDKYLESYEAKINKVKNAWTETTIALQEDFLGDGILAFTEVATGSIGIITDIIDKVGVLPVLFGTAGFAATAFGNQLNGMFVKTNIGREFTRIASSTTAMEIALNRGNLAARTYAVGATIATTATRALSGALTLLRSALLPMLLLSGVGLMISKVTGHMQEAKQAAEELEKKLDELNQANTDAVTKNKDTVNELLETYNELNDQKIEQGFLDPESDKEYIAVQNELAELFPALVSHIDEKGNAHLKSADAIKEETQATLDLVAAQNYDSANKILDGYDDSLDDIEEARKTLQEFEKERQDLIDTRDSTAFQNAGKEELDFMNEQIREVENSINIASTNLGHVIGFLGQDMLEVFSLFAQSLEHEVEPVVQEAISGIISSINFDNMNQDEAERFIANLVAEMERLNQAYATGDPDLWATAQSRVNQYIREADEDTEGFNLSLANAADKAQSYSNATDYAGDITDELGDSVDGTSGSMEGLADEVVTVEEIFDQAIGTIEALNGVLNQLDEEEGLSADSLNTMMEYYPELLAYMHDEVALREQIEKMIESEAETAERAMIEKMEGEASFFKFVLEGNSGLYESMNKMYGEDVGNFANIAQAKEQIEIKLLENLQKMWASYLQSVLGNLDMVMTKAGSLTDEGVASYRESTEGMSSEERREVRSNLHEAQMEQARVHRQMENLQREIDEVANVSFEASDFSGAVKSAGRDLDSTGDKAKKAGKKAKDAAKDAVEGAKVTAKEYKLSAYVADVYAQALERVNYQLERQQATTSKYPTHSKEYRDSLRKEIQLLQNKSNIMDKQAKDLEKQIKSGNIRQYGVVDSGSVWEYSISGGGSTKGVADYYLDNFRVSSSFGPRKSPGGIGSTNHKGVDLANGRAGDPVKALASGKVIQAAYSKSAGNMVVIQQDDGLVSKYMHLEKGLKVKAGQRVSAGTVLGGVGSTGNSTGNHLHLQIERDGKAFDPIPYLRKISSGSGGGYSGKYSKQINSAASKYGVDPNLIAAIIKHESNFNPNARSGAGAQGLMQLMPATARSLGVKNPFNASQNIDGGTKYIAQQLKAFDGDISKALAAYNAGPGNVKKHGGIPPFKETQNYVKNVLKTYNSSSGGAAARGGGVDSGAPSAAQLQSEASRARAEQQQSVDQARSDLLGMQHEMKEIADQVEELYFSIVESHLEQFDHERHKLNKRLAQIDYYQSRYDDGSENWVKQQAQREKAMREQNKIHRDSIKFIEKEIKTNKNLTKAQKMRLDDMLLDRQIEMWNLEQELLEQRITMAERVLDTYKRALEAHRDAALSSVDRLLKEIDEKEREDDYKKRLDKTQKNRQEILDEIAAWSIDGSDQAAKRVKELTEQLQEIDEEIDDMQHDKGIEDRKKALDERKESINEEYDYLINDERTFATMRSKIINNNTKDIEKKLTSFYKNIGKMTDDLGKATVRNLQRAINQMNAYMGNSNTKAMKIPKFHTGGQVKASGEGMILAQDKEIVLSQSDSTKFLKAVEMSRDLFSGLRTPKVPELISEGHVTKTTIGDITLHVGSLNGDKKSAEYLLEEIVRGVELKGGKMR